MKQLTESVIVGEQIRPSDMAGLVNLGVTSIINNRPDFEEQGQPTSEQLATAAHDLGLNYHHVPMSGGLSPGLIDEAVLSYANSTSLVYAFCYSGTRSTALWCFAHVADLGVDSVLATAAKADFSLEQLRPLLTSYLEQIGES